MTLLLGRKFSDRDTESATRVAVVNEVLAHHFYSGRNPVGKTFHFQELFKGDDIEVIGVVKNARYNGPGEHTTEMVLPVL